MKFIFQKGSIIYYIISFVFFIGVIFFSLSSIILSKIFMPATIIVLILGILIFNMSLPLISTNNNIYIPMSLLKENISNPIFDRYFKTHMIKMNLNGEEIHINTIDEKIIINNKFNKNQINKLRDI